LLEGRPNPLPVGPRLPGVLLTDHLVQQFCAGLDEVLAPVILTLDCWPAYLDPDTTPRDMIAWLGDWLGVVPDPRQTPEQQREFLRRTARLLRWRGTARGLREAVEFVTGVTPEIVEPGGAEWSERPGPPLPGGEGNVVTVRVPLAQAGRAAVRRIEQVANAMTPAHLRCVVEIQTPS
jgi:phage tail-like protein